MKTTPIYEYYKSSDAKLIEFGGYLLPVSLSGIKLEHQAVRTRAGLFDVSHMGEFHLQGPEAEAFLQKMITNNVAKTQPGDAQYTAMCYENGGTVDDLMVYRLAGDAFMLVVNAANIDKDFDWLDSHLTEEAVLTNQSANIALLALQGPAAEHILQKIADIPLAQISRFTFREHVSLEGIQALVSRTGYTGEDGFELYCPWEKARALWDRLLDAGKDEGLIPCGLGARDTLRFESCLPLYGQELSPDVSPLEAGIGFAVKAKKNVPFLGQKALSEQRENGLKRKIVGIEMVDRAIPRTHYEVYSDNRKIGQITTGTQSPTLGKNLGLALIDIMYTRPGTTLEVDIRGKRKKAVIVHTPFYNKKNN
ncbi:glycine cleavage system aminomethyltransferase GcvT [Sporolactobacillus sp. Y61]|uniref:Aminomethyltransferase n=1 Tax=Sporolactobacillus sp. Y61 TaxID=3160863 RepID=A0AAU8IE02_9BACL|nr:glycine cleavage system aminomethyltransferase GcvT [Sporolactobacillus sp. THM19-2]